MKQKDQLHPKVSAHYLLEKMRLAGAKKAYLALARGKWDIPTYFGNGAMVDMALAYTVTDLPYGVPFTIDSAFAFVQDKQVLFGFPDILISDDAVYVRLLARLQQGGADIIIGLFPAVNPGKMDMVDLSGDGTLRSIVIKPDQTDLTWTWIAAAWNPTFTAFLHGHVNEYLKNVAAAESEPKTDSRPEIHMGDIILSGMKSGLNVAQVQFPLGTYIDIGTPEDLFLAARMLAPLPERP